MAGESLAEETGDFGMGQSGADGLADGVVKEVFGCGAAVAGAEFGGAFGHKDAEAAARADGAFALQLAVGLGDGVGVDEVGDGELADRGELVAGDAGAAGHGVLYLADDLLEDRFTAGGVEMEDHGCITVLLQ